MMHFNRASIGQQGEGCCVEDGETRGRVLDGRAATFGFAFRLTASFPVLGCMSSCLRFGASHCFWCLTTEKVATSGWRHERDAHYSRRRIALPVSITESLILRCFGQLNPSNGHRCVDGEMGKDTLKHKKILWLYLLYVLSKRRRET